MTANYAGLKDYLAAAASQGRTSLEMSFSDVDDLVGGLPPSARTGRT